MYTYQKSQILGGLCVMTLFLSNTLLADYRYVFLTEGTTAAVETDIGYYDAFVQGEAISSGSLYSSFSDLDWQVIGSSTETERADVRLGMGVNQDVEIRMLTGQNTYEVVANNYAEFWDGALDHEISHHADGQELTAEPYAVWTGTSATPATDQYPSDGRLGGDSVWKGIVYTNTNSWAERELMTTTYLELRLYGMSQVISTAVPVPEPTTYLMLGSMLMVAVVCKRKKLAKRPLS
jgi:hypothetical protein